MPAVADLFLQFVKDSEMCSLALGVVSFYCLNAVLYSTFDSMRVTPVNYLSAWCIHWFTSKKYIVPRFVCDLIFFIRFETKTSP